MSTSGAWEVVPDNLRGRHESVFALKYGVDTLSFGFKEPNDDFPLTLVVRSSSQRDDDDIFDVTLTFAGDSGRQGSATARVVFGPACRSHEFELLDVYIRTLETTWTKDGKCVIGVSLTHVDDAEPRGDVGDGCAGVFTWRVRDYVMLEGQRESDKFCIGGNEFKVWFDRQSEFRKEMTLGVTFSRVEKPEKLTVCATIVNEDESLSIKEERVVEIKKDGDGGKIPFKKDQKAFATGSGWLKDGALVIVIHIGINRSKATRKTIEVKTTKQYEQALVPALTYNATKCEDNSKKDTGYVGLKNQGATCYMNSMLQSLFHTPAFRTLVYEMPTTGSEDVKTSIPLCLQRLFCRMQMSETACSTAALTKSFGWDGYETMRQHDVQEFLRVLLDNLETKMKGSKLEGRVAGLFRGKVRSYIRCKHVKYESSRVEDFYDLSLVVKDTPDLLSSFKKYVEPESLEGDNQYDTGSAEFGRQDAEMGTEFVEFPPILHLHLRRFEYDFAYDRMMKINTKFEFPESIDLAQFLAEDADRSKSSVFDLYGVLVHNGSTYGGHYYAFLRTSTDPQWFQFNDTHVTRTTVDKAVQDNYGGSTTYTTSYSYSGAAYSAEKSYNGYMLVYVRRADAERIFTPVPLESIPLHLRKAAESADDVVTDIEVTVSPEESLKENCVAGTTGFGYKCLLKQHTFNKSTTKNTYIYKTFSELFNVPVDEMRLWTSYTSFTPYSVLANDTGFLSATTAQLSLFLQRKALEEPLAVSSVMYFLKFFDNRLEVPLQYLGSQSGDKVERVEDLFPTVAKMLGFPENISFDVYEEMNPPSAKKIEPTAAYSQAYRSVTLIFVLPPGSAMPTTTYKFLTKKDSARSAQDVEETEKAIDQFKDYPHFAADLELSVESYFKAHVDAVVHMYDNPKQPVAVVRFMPTMSLDGLKHFLSNSLHLDYNPEQNAMKIYKQDSQKDGPGSYPLESTTYYTTLEYDFRPSASTAFFKIYILMVSISEKEIAKKTRVTCFFSKDGYNITGQTMRFFDRGEAVSKVRETLVSDGFLPEATEFRIARVSQGKYISILDSEAVVQGWDDLRFDVVPDEQKTMSEDEYLMQCVQLVRASYAKTTGDAFWFVVKPDETVGALCDRICNYIHLDMEEFKKCKFMFDTEHPNMTKARYLKPDMVVKDEIAQVEKDVHCDVRFYIVHPGVAPARHDTEAIKIYN